MTPAGEREDPSRHASVDEAWATEWAREGVRRLERLLALHAAFDRYLAERDHRIDR